MFIRTLTECVGPVVDGVELRWPKWRVVEVEDELAKAFIALGGATEATQEQFLLQDQGAVAP